ncbi:MAG: hypothetical protein ACOYM3_18870 [Terrimicrobiaceae bacterium]
MKFKSTVIVAGMIFVLSIAARAGPSISISFGSGGCNQQPVYCPPRPVCRQPVYPVFYAQPVVYYNQAPAACYGNVTRFSNVTGFVNGGQGVIRVSEPVYPVRPVVVYPQNNFRWR